MATSLVQSDKNMKRTEPRKSHSWWWDSHISPKNSKWLEENLEEIDRSIKRMLKLIEEDGDSFAKKAEMYYQKRPELITHVEEFYRLYRSLAERYDHVTGELRKSLPSDLQSQASCMSDIASELPSAWPSPDLQPQRLSRRKSGPRAAGFEFFLGSGGSTADNQGGDESSTLTDSEPESDDSSVNNYSGHGFVDHVQQRKIIELEIELREVKEQLQLQREEIARGPKVNNTDKFISKIAEYEQELAIANEKVRDSEEEIAMLNIKLKNYESLEHNNGSQAALESSKQKEVKRQEGINEASEVHERVGGSEEVQDPVRKIEALVGELRITKDRLQKSEKEIASLRLELESNKASILRQEVESNKGSEQIQQLQNQLESANKDIAMWKVKLNTEKKQVSKLQERITRLKTSLSDRDHEIMDLKMVVSDAEQKIFPEKSEVKAEISRLQLEQTRLEEQIRDWESRGRYFEGEIRKIKAGKTEMEERLNGEIKQLKADILERSNHIENLNKTLDSMKTERNELSTKVVTLKAEVSSRDDQISEMDKNLQLLHVEHAELLARAEGAHKMVEELTERAKELEEEIQRQRVEILEGAEEKREAIRQLCFSLEHYRNGYNMLRQACMGHNKRVPVLAS